MHQECFYNFNRSIGFYIVPLSIYLGNIHQDDQQISRKLFVVFLIDLKTFSTNCALQTDRECKIYHR